ncbi:hypothetical protein P7K49_000010 [Saguinus oedipus]|uniref:Uncharacterized protein n=1 Tax=Saguinus oedipus TaxID=9490 RepID=A0ABQ9WAG0_SAGOE|nr:hypothetical protein P7K49_000010 [Saguinus oedipus]
MSGTASFLQGEPACPVSARSPLGGWQLARPQSPNRGKERDASLTGLAQCLVLRWLGWVVAVDPEALGPSCGIDKGRGVLCPSPLQGSGPGRFWQSYSLCPDDYS